MGVSFEEVGANIALMTRVGLDAANATTYLRATLNALIKPSEQAKQIMGEVGMSFDDLREIIREKGTDRNRFFRGQVDKYTWVDLGSSYLPSELLSAFLCGQLEARERVQTRRAEIWRRYRQELSEWGAERGVGELDSRGGGGGFEVLHRRGAGDRDGDGLEGKDEL